MMVCDREAYQREYAQKRREDYPEIQKATNQESCRKGGKYYDTMLKYNNTGLRGMRKHVRGRHQHQYLKFKRIIAPDSQIHHEWIHGTADYRGVALVEADPHMYGVIDVIHILRGEITIFTEEALRTEVQ